MGIKNLTSLYDLVSGNDPVENMGGQQGPTFQLPTTDASQTHIDSLQQVPGPPSNSPYQDLDGNPDPNFNTLNGTTNSPFQSTTGDHMVDLLTQNAVSTNTGQTYTPSPNASPYQDLDGIQGPQSQLPTDAASQKHIDSLQVVPGGDSNSPFQDLNGTPGPNFGDEGGAGKQIDGVDLHEVLLTQNYQYSHQTPVVTVNGGTYDLDGGLPSNGEYLNNFPS